MRPTTLISFLATSLALLSQSPAAYAAPIPSQLNSGAAKRGCMYALCRVEEPTPSTTTSNPNPSSSSTPNTTSQTPTVLSLVDALINTLNSYRGQYTTSDPTPVTDFTTPDPSTEPTDDTTTTDGSPIVAAVTDIELAGE